MTFTTNDQVLSALQQACEGVDFLVWEGTRNEAYVEMQLKKSGYDGVLIIGGKMETTGWLSPGYLP